VKNFGEDITASLDINNTANASSQVDVSNFRIVSAAIRLLTGSYGTAILECECSADDTNWYSIPGGAVTISADGVTTVVIVGVKYFRLKVNTASGGAATAEVIVQMKK